MDEENNEEMRSEDLEQTTEKGAQAVKSSAKNAGDKVKNKAKNAIGNKIKGAKTFGKEPNEVVGMAEKAKGRAIEAKGAGKTALGGALTGAGEGARAAGIGTKAAAQGIRATGTLLSGIPYAGPAIKTALEASAKTMDVAGDKMNDFGQKMSKKGQQQVKSGMHDINRGRNLAHTGQDIGGGGEGNNPIGDIPAEPQAPEKPNINNIVEKAKKKSLFSPTKLVPKKVKIILIIVAIVVLFITIITLIVSTRVNKGSYREGDLSNVPYVVTVQIMNQIEIVTNNSGGYMYAFRDEEGNIIDINQAIENALKTLDENNSTSLSSLGSTDEERKILLKTLISAEIATQYPDISYSERIENQSTVFAGDYCVDISKSNSAKVCTEEDLKNMVNNSNLPSAGKQNVLSVIPDLIEYQNKYNVNAVFAISVFRVESGCGTGWDLIDKSTYNWQSIKGTYNGAYYTDRKGTKWRKYSSYSEASEDFFALISKANGYYFGSGRYTVKNIAPTYCNAAWGDSVAQYMSDFYSSIGITDSGITEENSAPPVIVADLEDDGSLQGKIIIQRRNNDGTTTRLKYTDENAFSSMVSANSDEVMEYYTLKKTATNSNNNNGTASYGGIDILGDWVDSWEIANMFAFRKGTGSYDSTFVKGYITEDGKNYICKTDLVKNGTLNYGFGVCVYNPKYGWINTDKFEKYGIDAKQSVLEQTQVDADIVDKISHEIVKDKYEYIKNKTESAGLNLSDNEIGALTCIAYQFGDGGVRLDSFISLYKEYGNSEELRSLYCSSGGKYFFKNVNGGSGEYDDKGNAIWTLFHDGIYKSGCGDILDPANYGETSSANINGTNVNNNNSAETSDSISVNGSTNKEKCWNFLTQVMGYSKPVAAGIMGNIKNESSFDPNADEGAHYGIVQWDKTSYPEINGKGLEEQFAFFKNWMSSSEFNEHAKNYKEGFSYNEFLSMSSAGEAARAFAVIMERFSTDPNCAECNERANDAELILSEHGGPTGSNSTNIKSLDNFLFIGDSRYVTSVSSKIEALGNNVKNAGIGSARVDEWLTVAQNGGTGTVQGKSVDITGKYSGVSVQLGSNSVSNLSKAQSDMKSLIESLKGLYPNTPIFVNSCMQVNPKSSSNGYSWDPALMRDRINDFNADISNYCSQVDNVYYIDISSNLNDSDSYIKAEYTFDGLHCNDEGGKVFTENIRNAILNASVETTQSNNSSTSSANSGNKYSLVVANKTIVDTTIVDSYTYNYTQATDTSNGSHPSATRFSETPEPQTVGTFQDISYSSTVTDYQTALKPYTLYFDFLWAILINSRERDFTLSWANLALNSEVYITAYSVETLDTSSNSEGKGVLVKSDLSESGIYTADYYDITQTTTINTTTITSKSAITDANTWLIDYKNDAGTYEEYQGRYQEQITEKIDPDDDGDNIVKLLTKDKTRLQYLCTEKYQVDRMIKDNEKVNFMSDIYEYILNIANDTDVDQNKQKLLASFDTSRFDLNNAMTITQKVLTYTALTITDEDKELLNKFVEYMGEGCSAEEKKCIASVVLNRALIGNFGGSTVSKVIKKSNQFENFKESSLKDVSPSEETKSIVNEVISSGDQSKYAVYFATIQTAEKKWDDDSSKKCTVSKDKYKFYTNQESEDELKKYETTVFVGGEGTYIPGNATGIAARMIAWAEQWVGKEEFIYRKGVSRSNGLCARFVMAAYDEVGLGYYGAASAKDLPHPNKMKFNSDGTVDWSEIPAGAILVSKGTGVHGHVCLYIGNGYVIEAGKTVKKSPINQSFAGPGHNCAPFYGWGFATRDQDYAYRMLVSTD